MAHKVRWTRLALGDLIEIRDYIAADDPDPAVAWTAKDALTGTRPTLRFVRALTVVAGSRAGALTHGRSDTEGLVRPA